MQVARVQQTRAPSTSIPKPGCSICILCIYCHNESRSSIRPRTPRTLQSTGSLWRKATASSMTLWGSQWKNVTAEGEQRMVTIGTNSFGELRVVVWTDRDGDNRTISVRKATPKERRDYES